MLLAAAAPSLAQFEAALAREDSATLALGQWCAARHIAPDPTIRAVLLRDAPAASPPRDLRRRLALPPGTVPAYRHVRLACGGTVLSEAHNWYVPGRIAPAMNQALDTTDTPFGKAVAALHFRREPLATIAGRAPPCPTGTLSTHRARLLLPDGTPLAMVVECYTRANLVP